MKCLEHEGMGGRWDKEVIVKGFLSEVTKIILKLIMVMLHTLNSWTVWVCKFISNCLKKRQEGFLKIKVDAKKSMMNKIKILKIKWVILIFPCKGNQQNEKAT